MIITYSVIIELLSKKYADFIKYSDSNDCPINNVHIYNGMPIEKETLYIINKPLSLKLTPAYKNSAFLICAPASIKPEDFMEELNIAIMSSPLDETQLLEDIFEIMGRLYKWDGDLKDSLLNNLSITEFFALGAKFISKPHLFVDKNFIEIAHSENFFDFALNAYKVDLDEYHADSKQVPASQVEELLQDEEFHFIENIKQAFIYPSYPSNYYYYCMNVYKSNNFIARFMVCLQKDEKIVSKGEAVLINHFYNYLKEIYLRYTGDESTRHQNDQMHHLLRTIFFDFEKSQNTIDINNIVHTYNWNINDEYSIIKFIFFEGGNWDTACVYICQQLEKEWNQACAVSSENSIICLLNHSQPNSIKNNGAYFESLAYIVRKYVCKAGISDIFTNFHDMKIYYRQAETALEIGQYKDPHFWYYYFKDYTYNYLIKQLTGEFTAHQLCHKGLLTLIEYDKHKHTDYVNTLYCYLLCNYNSTHTAEKLYIHRTSFLRRLDRIKKITGIDINNNDEMLYLLLSFKMMRTKNE